MHVKTGRSHLVIVRVREAGTTLDLVGFAGAEGHHERAAVAVAEVPAAAMHDPLVVHGHRAALDAERGDRIGILQKQV